MTALCPAIGRRRVVGSLLVVLAATVVTAQDSIGKDEASRRLASLAAGVGQPAPLMRIGLDSAHRIEIEARRP